MKYYTLHCRHASALAVHIGCIWVTHRKSQDLRPYARADTNAKRRGYQSSKSHTVWPEVELNNWRLRGGFTVRISMFPQAMWQSGRTYACNDAFCVVRGFSYIGVLFWVGIQRSTSIIYLCNRDSKKKCDVDVDVDVQWHHRRVNIDERLPLQRQPTTPNLAHVHSL